MSRTRTVLGLDLGPTSVGWAFLRLSYEGSRLTSGEILGTNSRIFPAAVDGQGKSQKPKNAARREYRHQRRQHRRKRQRRNRLRSILIANGLLPLETIAESSRQFNNITAEPEKCANPYRLRAKALDEKLELYEIGAALFHLAKRRGFKSSRIHGKSKEDGPVIKEIEHVRSEMAGFRTIGSFLNSLGKKRGSGSSNRRGYLARDDFEKEFEEIWSKQQTFYPNTLTNRLKQAVWEIIFSQRQARWDRSLIGKCSYDNKKKRCYAAHQSAQRFRYWQDINNIRIQEKTTFVRRSLSRDEKRRLAEMLERTEKISLDAVTKRLRIQGSFKVNLSGSKTALYGNRTAAAFRTKSLKSIWNNLTEEEREKLINAFYRIGDQDAILKKHLKEKWNFNDDQIENLLMVNLEQGFSRHSLNAINKMLPFFEQGYLYNEAYRLAKYREAFRAKWENIQELDREKIFEDLIAFKGTDSEVIHMKIRWGFDDELIERIEKTYAGLKNKFDLPNLEKLEPLAENLRNPIVQKCLTQVRKVVNEVIRTYGKPDEIRIELGRDLKMTADQKAEYEKQQRRNKKLNDDAERELGMYNGGTRLTSKQKLKYRLWRELDEFCDRRCPYSGEYITLEMLLEDGLIEIDHIIPYERCWDDSFVNKTICFGHVNREKGNRTPREYFGGNENGYYQFLQRVEDFPDAKRKRFEMKSEELADIDWAGRQLSDTRYISLKAREYLLQLYDNAQAVTVVTGRSTELLRRNWGLNKILNPDGMDDKNRRDHRHHAIDAIVVALTDSGLFDYISTLAGQNREEMHSAFRNFRKPWLSFFADVEKSINSIVVSHAPIRRVRGEYFKQEAYFKLTDGKFAHRVDLNKISNTNWRKIVDGGIRSIVKARLDEYGGNAVQAFTEPLYISHTNPKKKDVGKNTRISKVRVYEDKFVERKAHIRYGHDGKPIAYYASGGNHHAELIENIRTGKRRIYVVSSHEAFRNVRMSVMNGGSASPNTWDLERDEKPVFTLAANDYVEFCGENNELNIYRVQKVSQGEKGFEIMLRSPYDGFTEAKEGEPVRIQGVAALSRITRKFQVDPLGRLSETGD